MKKKIVSLLLSVVLILGILSPACFSSAQDTSALIQALSRVPELSTWDDYIDITDLQRCYSFAQSIMQQASPSQDLIDLGADSLNDAIDRLQYHTKGISLSAHALSLEIGQDAAVEYTLTPQDAADAVSFISSAPSCVSISNSTIHVLKYSPSPVKITAVSNGFTDECIVTVINPVRGVRVVANASVYETRTVQLSALAYGLDEDAPTTDAVEYEWESSDDDVAQVSNDGLVTGMAVGECTITVIAYSGGEKYKASCKISVLDYIPIQSFTPVTSSGSAGLTVTAGACVKYVIAVSPNDATDKSVSWSCENQNIAYVASTDRDPSLSTATAVVQALNPGTTVLHYEAADGCGVSGSVKITVKPLISSVTISDTTVVMNPDSVKQLTVKCDPANAGTQLMDWKSSDSSICSVDYKGNLTAKALGICTITATTTDGTELSVYCNVRVAEKAASVLLSPAELQMISDEKQTLSAVVTTVDQSTYNAPGEVLWTSSDTQIAKVDEEGTVTAGRSGSALIIAAAKDGSGIFGSAKITVTSPVVGISLPASVKINVGKTQVLCPSFTPTYATNQNVSWRSEDSEIAEVLPDGTVKANKPGAVKIICTSESGGHEAVCLVTVAIPATGVTLDINTLSMYVGTSRTLSATVSPATATDKELIWTSDRPEIAAVSKDGTITAKRPGEATIIAATSDDSAHAYCVVTCVQTVNDMILDAYELEMYQGLKRTLTATILPATAENKEVSYYSSAPKIASVNVNGLITANAVGTATITVRAAENGILRTCKVTVVPKINVASFDLEPKIVKLLTEEKFTLQAQIFPSDASEKGIIYKSSDIKIATVDPYGEITAVGPGSTTIVATTRDGDFTQACTVNVTQPVKGIAFKAKSKTVNIGDQFSLIPTFTPENATNQTVSYVSSDRTIASVTQKGVVTAVAKGSCTITATSKDGNYSASCKITVNKPVKGIRFAKTSYKVAKGEKLNLNPIFTPADASDQAVTYSTSVSSIASVSKDGIVSAKKVGSCVITCKTHDGNLTTSCKIIVFQPVTSLTLSVKSLSLNSGSYKTLKATVAPTSATDPSVTWSSLDKTVATVNQSGKVTAVAKGTTKIVVKSNDGQRSAYCTVTVAQSPTAVKLNASKLTINVGSASTLKATVTPSYAFDTSVTFSSSNNKVATVSSSGRVKALKTGKAVITCLTNVGNKKATCTVTCKIPPKTLTLNRKSVTLSVGGTASIVPTISPANTTNKTVTYKSSNTKIASVSSAGLIKAKAIGSAVITATTADGGLTATCKVSVPQKVTGLSLNKTTAQMYLGYTLKLEAKVIPSNATIDTVIFSSSDTKIATVNKSGVVTGKALGAVVISATTADGGFVKKCIIKVVQPVTKVTISQASAKVTVGKTLRLSATVSPSSAYNKKVTWYSSNTSVATVNSSGVVTAKKAGKAVITVKTNNLGLKKTCNVTVIQPVVSVTLPATAELYTGNRLTLRPKILPSDASNQKVTWSVSNGDIASVSSSGVVTAKKKGTVTVSCQTNDGAKKASCKITVRQSVTDITLQNAIVSLDVNQSAVLKYDIYPSNAYNKAVTFTSSDPKVVEVSAQGTIKTKAIGSAVITVTSVDGGFSDTCLVKVTRSILSLRLSESTKTLQVGEAFLLTTIVDPIDIQPDLSWQSMEPEIATVEDGTITALAPGNTKIVCVTTDGEHAAYCDVTVVPIPVDP